ncbi:ABC transporter permease [Croceicoccus naphthovorans]|uniref:Transport permease protein n=1 Tax=Croceicoccus naphthovorans TaxID=1348774 RepID=A0A0G3XEZ3_9SPHN|nr:ABC transporter permease [Croceicoccus naphthovorans]AKM09772.1 sugar ABC transporter permease [Croceicoccus naphthovorans]MBB3990682.1 ABC-2 type transport system permease protein [Croceicoccus naphthovorans]
MTIGFNARSAWAIYVREVSRAWRTVFGTIISPVITTCLYFIVFGAAIGNRMSDVGGVDYGAFIVPGLLLLTLLSESTSNGSFGIYMPRFTGAIYELLSAPVSVAETLVGFVGAAVTKSLIIAGIILATATLFVDYHIAHPVLAFFYIVLVASAFSLFGFILGLWADGFEKLQMVPLLVLTPLTFLGGTFYSIDMLAEPWRTVALFNPIVYLVSGLRWTFFEQSDVSIGVAFSLTMAFLAVCIVAISLIFRTGWRLRD